MVLEKPRNWCQCGCGEVAKLGNQYTNGHNTRITNPMDNPNTRHKVSLSKRGRVRSDTTMEKVWITRAGWTPSDETRQKISQAMKLIGATPEFREHMKQVATRNWDTPEIRDKITRASIQGSQASPTRPELKLIKIIEDYELPFIYNGNQGHLIIEGLCPDFYSSSNKCIIEVYGDYWHQYDTKDREKIYKGHGYQTLILWESEVKEYSDCVIALFLFSLLHSKL